MKHIYVIQCEWDIGHERLVFKTEELAWKYVESVWDEQSVGMSINDAEDDGLISVERYRFFDD